MVVCLVAELHITYHKRNLYERMVTMDEQTASSRFWFDGVVEGEMRPEWWEQSDEFDAQICGQFGEMHERRGGEFDHWAETEEGALAPVIILDQFSRISTAPAPRPSLTIRKRSIAEMAIEKGWDQQFQEPNKVFFICHTSTAKTLGTAPLLRRAGKTKWARNTQFAMKLIERFAAFRTEIKCWAGRTPRRRSILAQPREGFEAG